MSDQQQLRNFVNGEYVEPSDGGYTDLVDPCTGEVFAQAPASGAADVDAAMRAASAAFETWRDTTPGERQRALLKLADAVEARAAELVDARRLILACAAAPEARAHGAASASVVPWSGPISIGPSFMFQNDGPTGSA